MATLKDVAEQAGVSTSTVSIILHGKSKERKIPSSTQEKVLEAVKAVGYQPNLSARRLRESDPQTRLIVALYWASDFRTTMLARFLQGLSSVIGENSREIELVVHTYKNNELNKDTAILTGTKFNAVIVANASIKDMEFLNSIQPVIPVVLYNRASPNYTTVNVDDVKMGCLAAEHLADCGYKNIGVITSDYIFSGMRLRDEAFITCCKKHNIAVHDKNIIHAENTVEGGVEGARHFVHAVERPDAIFCASDALAYGTTYTFHHNNISIPKNIALIAIGNGVSSYSEYSTPSLTVIQLPMEKMAQKCMQFLMEILNNELSENISELLDTPLIIRESTLRNY